MHLMMCFIDSDSHPFCREKETLGHIHLMHEAAVPLPAPPKPLPELMGVFLTCSFPICHPTKEWDLLASLFPPLSELATAPRADGLQT